MLRKSIVSLVLCIALLLIAITLVSAQTPGQAAGQMDMSTPTATALPEATPAADLPLAGSGDLPLSGTQTGTCPMMNGTSTTGMGNMGGMQGMSGMGMNGMSGGMMNMGGMPGMNMSGSMSSIPVPWYSDPWWLLGWVLLTLVTLAILFAAAYGLIQLTRRSRSAQPPAAS